MSKKRIKYDFLRNLVMKSKEGRYYREILSEGFVLLNMVKIWIYLNKEVRIEDGNIERSEREKILNR